MQKLITITHSQINVFDILEPDFNLWDNNHVAQGFSWRGGHVSFGVPDHDGQCLVETHLVESFPPFEEKILRAIRVPISASANLFVASTVDEYQTDIPKGDYEIEFRLSLGNLEHKTFPHTFLIDFFFKNSTEKTFSILRKSDEMTSDKVLTTVAKPAI